MKRMKTLLTTGVSVLEPIYKTEDDYPKNIMPSIGWNITAFLPFLCVGPCKGYFFSAGVYPYLQTLLKLRN